MNGAPSQTPLVVTLLLGVVAWLVRSQRLPNPAAFFYKFFPRMWYRCHMMYYWVSLASGGRRSLRSFWRCRPSLWGPEFEAMMVKRMIIHPRYR